MVSLNREIISIIVASIGISFIVIGFIFFKLRQLLLAFLIGSSLPVTIFSLSYIGIANLKFKGIDNYEYMAIYVPLFYGIFNIISVILSRRYQEMKYLVVLFPFIVGGIQGLLFSSVGRFIMRNLPIKNFGFTEKNVDMVHLYAFLYYAAIHGIFITFINKLFSLY